MLTSKEPNIHRKLLRNARLPAKPVHRPRTPCARTICRAQSIGPLYCRSAVDFCSCNCNLTADRKHQFSHKWYEQS